jgi:hypothetical protein
MPASMGREQTDTQRVARSVTTGGDSRPPRAIRRPLVVNVADQASELMSEPEWQTGDRNSITVATTDRLPGHADGSPAGRSDRQRDDQ